MTVRGNERHPARADVVAHYMTSQEIAARYRVTDETVRWWRHTGRGPAWFKVSGGRRVLYDRAVVDAYDAAQQAGGVA